MANYRDIFKRRQGLNAVTGFNGGSLQDQLDEDVVDVPPSTRPRMVNPRTEPAQPNEFAAPSIRDRQQPPMVEPVPVDDAQPTPMRNVMTRPRVATNPFYDRMMSDPTRQERPREVNPTDEVTKSADYVRQIQDKPLSLRDKFGLAAQNISQNLGGTPLATRRQRDLARAGEGLQRDLTVQGQELRHQALSNQMDRQRMEMERIQTPQERGDERERDNVRGAWQAILSSGQDFSADNPEHKRLHDRAESLGITLPYGKRAITPRAARGAQTGKQTVKGVTYQTEYDPETDRWVKSKDEEGNPIVLSEEKPETGVPPAVIDENVSRIKTQQDKIDAFLKDEKNHYVTKPEQILSTDAEGNVVTKPATREVNPEWETAKKERNTLDAEIRNWEGKRKGGGSQTAPTTTTQNYQGRTMSKANLAKYARDHKMTPEAAQKDIEGQGIQIR